MQGQESLAARSIDRSRVFLLFDLDKCVGCRSCEVSCKQENDVPVGLKWIRIMTDGPREVMKRMRMHFVPRLCMHCRNPQCLAICPTKAVRKRRDGIVLVDEEKCIGCKYCIWACPYGAPQFDEDKKAVRKCTLCVHRMDKGLKPSCASHCPAKAIYLCDLNELAKITRGKHMIGEGVVRFAITTP